jgi:DNA-binding NtrC family response regulator
VPAGGTTFQVFLPRSTLERAPASASTGARPGEARGETVLVVEDETGVRRIAVRALVDAGYRVLEATNVAEAVAVAGAAQGTIDLLLTDLVLPDGGGGEVARRITELRPGIRVLYVSGYTDDPALRRDISENEVEFLGKPFSPDQLSATVRKVLDRPLEQRPKRGQ